MIECLNSINHTAASDLAIRIEMGKNIKTFLSHTLGKHTEGRYHWTKGGRYYFFVYDAPFEDLAQPGLPCHCKRN